MVVDLTTNRTMVRAILKMRATVWGRSAGGTFTAPLKTNLACLLTEVEGGRQPGATAPQRRDLANLGTFQWDATYDLPETGAQIEITGMIARGSTVAASPFPGKRWNPVASTYWPEIAPGKGILTKSIDVVRAT